MRNYTRDQIAAMFDELEELVGLLRPADDILRRLSYNPDRGWAPRRGLDSGTGAGPSLLVENEQGDLERVDATGVEVAALATDEMTDAKHLLWRAVETSHRAITNAWNAYHEAVKPLTVEKPPPVEPVAVWCLSCARFGIHQPRGTAKEVGSTSVLCTFCHSWQRTHDGSWPPQRLCELKAEGKTITARLVAEIEVALQREARERAAAKRKKKKNR